MYNEKVSGEGLLENAGFACNKEAMGVVEAGQPAQAVEVTKIVPAASGQYTDYTKKPISSSKGNLRVRYPEYEK